MNSYAEEINSLKQVHTYTKQLCTILGDKYKNADKNKAMKNQCQNLTEMHQNELLKLLQEFDDMVGVTFGTYKHIQ